MKTSLPLLASTRVVTTKAERGGLLCCLRLVSANSVLNITLDEKINEQKAVSLLQKSTNRKLS